MRLGINGFFLDKPMTGSGQYVRNLLAEFTAMKALDLTAFCPSDASAREAAAILAGKEKSSIICVKAPALLRGNLGKLWFEQIGLPWASRQAGIDVLHVPYFGSPLFPPCPTVVTVHDLISLVLPQYRRSVPVKTYAALASASAKKARVIIADSEFTRKDILRLLDVGEERVVVVPLACEARFRPINDSGLLESVRRDYGLAERFVLYIGGLDSRKNVPALIRAFAATHPDCQLAIAGEPHAGRGSLFANLLELAIQCGIEGRVRFLGLVPEEQKPALYSLATLFVFPSIYEGFGLTPLEAMACGAPVLSSNATSLPEVVGDAAVLFDPKDEKAFGEALSALLRDDKRREELRLRGLAQAGKFSWRRTAEEMLAAYEKAMRNDE
ncbi:MAG: glycosyltransferase family 4 protein [Chloroflexi bacterium]|nr:glycosyltransferase family 4 protein [Chloroflexota bacterium]